MTPREFFRSRSSISLGVSPGTTYSAGTADQMLPRNCWTETGAKAITRSRKNGANRAKTSASQFHEEYSYYSGNAVCNPQVLPAFSAIKSVEEGICFVNQARHILPPRCWEEMVEHRDRKSTRLNSSHSQISYAVFCLKKKNILCDYFSLCNLTAILRFIERNVFESHPSSNASVKAWLLAIYYHVHTHVL